MRRAYKLENNPEHPLPAARRTGFGTSTNANVSDQNRFLSFPSFSSFLPGHISHRNDRGGVNGISLRWNSDVFVFQCPLCRKTIDISTGKLVTLANQSGEVGESEEEAPSDTSMGQPVIESASNSYPSDDVTVSLHD